MTRTGMDLPAVMFIIGAVIFLIGMVRKSARTSQEKILKNGDNK